MDDSEAALKAVLPEGLASGIEDEFKESWRPALLVRKSFLDLRDNFRRIADPPTWPTEAKGVFFCFVHLKCIRTVISSNLVCLLDLTRICNTVVYF